MPWAFVRPVDPTVLEGRPLLDLGTGDGQTLATLAPGPGLVVGMDRSPDALRAAGQTGIEHRVCADAQALPFTDAALETVLAGDVFHHLPDEVLEDVLTEICRVLRAGGRLVAWWYEFPGRPAPDSPRYPRELGQLTRAAQSAGFEVTELALQSDRHTPPTVGLVGTR